MFAELLAGDGTFGVVLIERGSEVGGNDVRHRVGTRAEVQRAEQLPDGRIAVLARGVDRFFVQEWLPADPYPVAMVVPFAEPAESEPTPGAPFDELKGAVIDKIEAWWVVAPPPNKPPVPINIAARVLADYVSVLMGFGPFDAQQLLECQDPQAQLRLLIELIDDAILLETMRQDED